MAVDYWMSTKSDARLSRPSYHTPERDDILRRTAGVDPVMLISETGLTVSQITAYQRYLGVRKITSYYWDRRAK